MKLHSKILKNTLSVFFVRVASPVITFLLLVVISRMLGAEELGKYSVLIAFLQIAQFLPLLGLHTYIIREIAKDYSLISKYVPNAIFIGAASSVILSVTLYVVAIFLGYPQDMMVAICVVCFTIMPNALILVFESAIMGYERMEFIAFTSGLESILKVICSLLSLYFGGGVISLIVVLSLSRIFTFVLYFFVLRKIHGSFSIIKFDFSVVKHLYKIAPVFLGVVLFSSFINRIDFVVLSKLKTFEEVGLYTVAYRTFEMATMFSTAFLIAIFPTLSRLQNKPKEELILVAEKSIVHLTQVVIIFGAGIFIFADDFIIMFFSENFVESIFVLRLIIATVIFVALDQMLAGVIIASNYQTIDLQVVFTGFTIYILCLLLLVPPFGINGAAVATLSATSTQFMIRNYLTQKYVLKIRIWHNIWRQAFAGICTIAISLLFLKFYWIVAIPFVCIIYVSFLFLFGSLTKKEINSLVHKVNERQS